MINSDEKEEATIDPKNEDKYPSILNKVTLFVYESDGSSGNSSKDGGLKWFTVDGDNNYELVSSEWGNLGEIYRWGEIQNNHFKDSKVPESMIKKARDDPSSVEATIWNFIITLKTFAKTNPSLMKSLSTSQAGPWSGTHSHSGYGMWWIGKEKPPYLPTNL